MTFTARHLITAAFALSSSSAQGCGDDAGDAMEASSPTLPSTSAGDVASGTTGFVAECTPGEVRCGDATALERCAPTGKQWILEPCPSSTACVPCGEDNCTQDRCVGPCDSVDELPSSAGCSFIANRQLHATDIFDDGLIVANPNSSAVATVQFYSTPEGSNQEILNEEIVLNPLESHVFLLSTNFVQGDSSMYRTGGTHRVQSDVPVVAYHHAPFGLASGNDSSLLLPESSLRNEYVVYSYGPNLGPRNGEPSYFEVVALENFTNLEWFPPVDTAGNGLPIPFVAAGEQGALKMNRFDTVRIAASANFQETLSLRDVSGTVVRADKPIWVTSGAACARVPTRDVAVYPTGHCDPLQEMPIPLEYWGSTYVGIASPLRGSETHWWRLYAGKDGVEIVTDPPQTGGPIVLEKRGDFAELEVASGQSVVFRSSNGVFMPVQYLQGKRFNAGATPEPEESSAPNGDPSMYQMIPTEQFLSRYVFVTAVNFPFNYVQVIRSAGGPPVELDGEPLDEAEYQSVAEFEVATFEISEGPHLIESDDEFGIIQVGYSQETRDPNCLLEPEFIDENGEPTVSCPSSYAYPGGMRADPIFIP